MSQPTHQHERKSAAPVRQVRPRAAAPHPALALMDQLGNRGLRALRGRMLQRKAEGVSVPADPLEVGADRVADRVLGASVGTVPSPAQGAAAPGAVQRDALSGAGMPHLPGPPTPSGPPRTTGGTAPRGALANELMSGLDAGRSIPRDVRHFMEDRFGRSFAEVRIHTGEQAATAARSVAAKAFTVGSEIVFGEGKWAPETREGKRLLAHELAHVVQQGTDTGPLASESVTENEAYRAGMFVSEGVQIEALTRAIHGQVQRDEMHKPQDPPACEPLIGGSRRGPSQLTFVATGMAGHWLSNAPVFSLDMPIRLTQEHTTYSVEL